MALPPLTAEERALALAKAAAARKQRAEVKDRLKQGDLSVAEVIALGAIEEAIGKIRVVELLESMPGVGRVRAGRLMTDLRIAHSRRVRGLGNHQRAALIAEFPHGVATGAALGRRGAGG